MQTIFVFTSQSLSGFIDGWAPIYIYIHIIYIYIYVYIYIALHIWIHIIHVGILGYICMYAKELFYLAEFEWLHRGMGAVTSLLGARVLARNIPPGPKVKKT